MYRVIWIADNRKYSDGNVHECANVFETVNAYGRQRWEWLTPPVHHTRTSCLPVCTSRCASVPSVV